MRSVPLRAAPFLTQHVGTCVPLPLRSADDPTMVPGAGVPVNMTMISSKLKTAGYHSHFIGKWHVGMASRSTQTPQARDFETTLNYFDSGNNYYDSTTEQSCHDPTTKHEVQAVDLWNTTGPARHMNGTYEELLFGERAVQVRTTHLLSHSILKNDHFTKTGSGQTQGKLKKQVRFPQLVRDHDVSTPFFLYYAFHTSCTGYDASGKGGSFDPFSALQPVRKRGVVSHLFKEENAHFTYY
jgi:arylsulfatase A-like enzyme